MGEGIDIDSITKRAGEMYDRNRPGFIHAARCPGTRQGWVELEFPDGLVCATNSNPVETELAYNEIYVGKEYLRSGIILNDSDTVVDVGANIGLFAMYILRNLKHPTLYAIEPVQATYDVLCHNVGQFTSGTVSLHNVALGSRAASEAEITFFTNMTGNSTEHPEIKKQQREALASLFTEEELEFIYTQKQVRVPSTTLTAIMNDEDIQAIDLLKIDTEGAEVDILNGIDDADWTKIRQIVLEVHAEGRTLPIVDGILRAHGMTMFVDESTRDPFGTVVASARQL